MIDLQNYILSIYKKFNSALGNNFNKHLQIQNKTKLDMKKINDMLLFDYAKKFLETLKQELEDSYSKEREKEKRIEAHTEKHHIIVQRMHDITENLEILNNELSNLTNIKEQLTNKLKNDLKLHPYKK